MPIWFVYRSPEEGPLSKYVKRLDGADTLLDWFRSIWRPIADHDEAYTYADDLLGTHVNWFGLVFQTIAEENLSAPTTVEWLHTFVQRAMDEGVSGYRGTKDTIQALNGAHKEWTSALYWFTDDFARAHPERVAYLLREDWRLPETVGVGGFTPKPGVRRFVPATASRKAVYFVELYWSEDRYFDLEELEGAEKYPEMHLPDLVPFVLGLSQDDRERLDCSPVFRLREPLRKLLQGGEGLEGAFRRTLFGQPDDAATWAAYSDWLVEQDRPRAELHLLELALRELATTPERFSKTEPVRVQVATHCAVMLLPQWEQMHNQWFFFDDVWASGNVDLANALLDAKARYNVLDTWEVLHEHAISVPAGQERGPK
jgi:uncharacterized protein (TIGR02996 family)